MFKKLVKYYISSFFKPMYFLCIVVFFVLNVFLVNSSYSDFIPNGYVNQIVFMFYMPLDFKFDLLRWLLITLPILLSLSSFILNEVHKRPAYIILRMKNYSSWFHSMFISIFIIIIVTIGIGFGITGITIFLFNSQIVPSSEIGLSSFLNTNEWVLMLNQFTLVIFTLMLLLILHTIFSFLVNNSAFAMLLVIISMISSATIGYIFPSLIKMLPLTYMFLGFREIKGISFFWSNSIIFICIVLLYCLLYFLFKNLKEKIVSV